MPRIFFEDFSPGSVATVSGPTVTKDDILAFAREFDPQPFHVDEEAAKASFVGGLIASGWHTCALTMRMVADGFLQNTSAMGAPGIEEVKWQNPVRPGDTLSLRRTVLETRESRSRPEMGLVRILSEVLNQAGEIVMTQVNWTMFGRRHAGPASASPLAGEAESRQRRGEGGGAASPGKPALPSSDQPSPVKGEGEREPPATVPFLDDIEPGDGRKLGSYTFTPEAIVAFASRFDPQPFHLDDEAARRSHFGGLVASGWHTAAVWMKLMVRDLARATDAALGRGERPARLGPSPGFRDLKWLKPVHAGDTITYGTRAVDKRSSGSQPGWGLLFHENTGVNQKGEEVFSFRGAVYWERRPS